MKHTHEPSPLHVLALSAFVLAVPLYAAVMQSERSIEMIASAASVEPVQFQEENNGCFFDSDCYPFEECKKVEGEQHGECQVR